MLCFSGFELYPRWVPLFKNGYTLSFAAILFVDIVMRRCTTNLHSRPLLEMKNLVWAINELPW